MKPYPDDGRIIPPGKVVDKPKPAPQQSAAGPNRGETRSVQLGAGAENARQIFAALEAGRLHDLTERYRERHGDGAWEHLITVLPRWRADAGMVTGFHGEQALELLPTVMNDGERFEIAQAVWGEQYMGVHEYIDLGEVKSTEHLDAAVRRRVAFAISKPTDKSGTTERMHDTLFWLCAEDDEAKEKFVKRLEVAELGRAITPVREGVRAMRAEIDARADGWTGRVERRIRSGPNTFDIALQKSEPVKLTWHASKETAEALRAANQSHEADYGAEPPSDTNKAGTPEEAAPTGVDTATGADAQPRRLPRWLQRLAGQIPRNRGAK